MGERSPQTRLQRFLDSDFVFDFKRSPLAIVGATLVLTLFVVALFAPLIAPNNPFDPASLNLMNGFKEVMVVLQY